MKKKICLGLITMTEKSVHLSGSKVLSELKSYRHFNAQENREVVIVSTPIPLSKKVKHVSEGEF
jgi:hypothetical protein